MPEGGALQHGQPLVVVHGEHGVGRQRCAPAETRCRPAADRRARARSGAAARWWARSPRFPRGRDGRLRRRAGSGRTPGCAACAPRRSRRRSASRMRSTDSSRCGVTAAGTPASGRWVVASATRRPPPTSIITGSAAPQRAARYSVWPVKGTPASLMTPLCTGAVTIASNSPARQPSTARSSSDSTYRAFAGSSRPARQGAAERHVQHLDPTRGAGGRVVVGQGVHAPALAADPPEQRPVRQQHDTTVEAPARQRRAQVRSDAGRLPGRQRDGRELARRAHRYST